MNQNRVAFLTVTFLHFGEDTHIMFHPCQLYFQMYFPSISTFKLFSQSFLRLPVKEYRSFSVIQVFLLYKLTSFSDRI